MFFRAKGRRPARAAAVLAVILLCLPLWAAAALPAHLRLAQDQDYRLRLHIPVPVTVRTQQSGLLALNGAEVGPTARRVATGGGFSLAPLALGQAHLDFKLFGWIPLRRMTVDVVPQMKLIPGGHSIGVLLRSRGMMVVGFGQVSPGPRRAGHPARDAGVEIGDVIVRMNGQEVTDEEQAAQMIDTAGRNGVPLYLELRRRGSVVHRMVQPVRDTETGQWRIGLYIRDGAMGIGTLTFYDPDSRRYGALGHIIADSETNEPIEVREGRIVPASVTSIQPGAPGHPGEKVGTPEDSSRWIGSIDLNTRYGIFGDLRQPLANPLIPGPIPVGMASQVQEGPAELITVVEDRTLERFAIEILRINRSADVAGKNLIVRITDPRLLGVTRGIVQGMSGSPILQGGRLVGAVTHVFVNDPSRGYGVLMEWMLHEAGLLRQPQAVRPAAELKAGWSG